MNWLRPIISKKEKLVVGLISGTSMDGIDAALVRVCGSGEDTEVRIEEFICREYSDAARNLLLSPGSLNVETGLRSQFPARPGVLSRGLRSSRKSRPENNRRGFGGHPRPDSFSQSSPHSEEPFPRPFSSAKRMLSARPRESLPWGISELGT